MQLFTVDQANRTLPLVRRIVEDVVRQHRAWQDKIVELDLLVSAANTDQSNARAAALEREIRRLATELDGFDAELAQIGVQLKDRRIGLIDYPSELDGRRILLCWRLGEPSVQYWHDVNAGFASRQLLSPTLVG